MVPQCSIYLRDTELRKLRFAELSTLGRILDELDSWKRLMAIIPKDDASNLPKFNIEDFSMIEQAAEQQKRSAAEIFLSEWGTMGKRRPTLAILLDFLVKADLFKAADYVASDILKEELPERPKFGPAAPVDISDVEKLLEQEFEESISNESLIVGLSYEVNDNKAVNPNALNTRDNSSLEKNIESTKLVSSKGNKEHLESLNESQVSDLMKFTKQDVQQKHIFEQEELSSQELPVFMKRFRQVQQEKLNQEVCSEELPVFLNRRKIASNTTVSEEQMNNSSHSNSTMNNDELTSAELPECIIGLHGNRESNSNNNHGIENNENISENVLRTQELPITVIKYNK